jgi:RNA polymerase sigma-70 factor (ECF subfamily)
METSVNWDKVVDDIGPRLFRYFCVRFSKEQSDDLTQETLIRLVRKVEDNQFNPDKGTLKMLSFGIAHYVALEVKQLEPNDSIDDWADSLVSDVDLERTVISQEMVHRVRQYIKNLSDIEQQVLSLFVDDELTIVEIGKILKVPDGTIKSHIFRAKQKLVNLIQKENLL